MSIWEAKSTSWSVTGAIGVCKQFSVTHVLGIFQFHFEDLRCQGRGYNAEIPVSKNNCLNNCLITNLWLQCLVVNAIASAMSQIPFAVLPSMPLRRMGPWQTHHKTQKWMVSSWLQLHKNTYWASHVVTVPLNFRNWHPGEGHDPRVRSGRCCCPGPLALNEGTVRSSGKKSGLK